MKKPLGGYRPPRIRKPVNPFDRIARGLKAAVSEPVAPRRRDFEQQLCAAMDGRQLVELRYDDDVAPRLFQPEGLFQSAKGKVCVAGVQVRNPNKLGEDGDPHTFEVGKIADLRVSEARFLHPVRFDPTDPKYQNGVICCASPI